MSKLFTIKLRSNKYNYFIVIQPYPIQQITIMYYHNPTDQLILIDNRNNLASFFFQEPGILQLITGFTLSGHIQEASDIALYKGCHYITDYKTHCIVVFTFKGKFIF